TTGVYVNLVTQDADGIKGSVSHIQQIIGTGRGDVLVGSGTGMLLQEGTGKNLLIAGSGGGSTIYGGIGEDIIIAGTTQYDSNSSSYDARTALSAIEDFWSTNTGSFWSRVDILQEESLNGIYFLSAFDVTHH